MQQLPLDLTCLPVTNDQGEIIQHVLDSDTIQAVNAALAINRPLLIWGEPGIGKSQLAKAIAKKLHRPYLSYVADGHTQSHDLLWHFDAIGRLAQAQLGRDFSSKKDMAIKKFIVPGVLWWALNWKKAKKQAKHTKMPVPEQEECDSKNGCVVLIDEMDKADSDVPNGLLEALGANRFHPKGLSKAIERQGEAPLIFLTTNKEKSLPNAFIRRCLSLHLRFPESEDEQKNFLVERATCNAASYSQLTENDFCEAADMLIEDRQMAKDRHWQPLPGQAEYFDLLRGLERQSKDSQQTASDMIKVLRKYTFQKHSGFHENT